MMSFSGKYELERQEGFVPFMKAVGISDDLIEKGKDMKSVSEIEQNGDNFKVTVTTGSNVMVNAFTIGQETEVLSMTGEKIKTVVKKDSNKLITNLKGCESVTELFDGNTLVHTLTLGDIVYKRISKRVS